MRVKTIIIDDEPPICDEIEYLLKREADIEVTAKFTNSLEALTYLSQTPCDLVFLDIKMPGMSGLELAQRLSRLRRLPLLVFVTAFPEHALEAFGTPAVGYMTKPVTQAGIDKVIDKIRGLLPRSPEAGQASRNKLCVLRNGKIIPLDKQDIVLIYIHAKDVLIRTKDTEFRTTLTLQEIEGLLPSSRFLRVHRQYIVNMDKITEIIPWFHGSYMLRMDDANASEVPVSRTKSRDVKQWLGLK